MDTSQLVVVSVLEGRNFNSPETHPNGNEDDLQLSDSGQYFLFLEARFNDEILTSDPIRLSLPGTRTEIYTELAWQLTKKSLHSFKIERVPIKLQCFIQHSSTHEKIFVGYLVLDLRTAQETEEPKYEWKPLLNSKYHGNSKSRPEINIALHISHGPDVEDGNSHHEVEQNRNSKHKNLVHHKAIVNHSNNDLEYDIQVKEVDGWFKIWDCRNVQPSGSNNYHLSVVIVSAENLSLIAKKQDPVSNGLNLEEEFYFKFSILGKTVRTKPFHVPLEGPITIVDIPVEKITYKISPSNIEILRKYFELNSSFEIFFCSSSKTLAEVSIPLTNFYIHENGPTPVVGEFTLTGDFDDVPQSPTIGVYVALEKVNGNKSPSSTSSMSSASSPLSSPERNLNIDRSPKLSNGHTGVDDEDIHHFCLSIDIRNLRPLNSQHDWTNPHFIQYSYSFFGPTSKIKTNQVRTVNDEMVGIESGYFSFKFSTTYWKLRSTLNQVSLNLELIEVCSHSSTAKNIIRGISHVNLLPLVDSQADVSGRKLLVVQPFINDYEDKRLAQTTVIFSLQDLGVNDNVNGTNSSRLTGNHHLNASTTILEAATGGKRRTIDNINDELFNSIDNLFIEATLEIEAWKQLQMKLFKEQMLEKEKKYLNHLMEKKMRAFNDMEEKLKESLENVKLKEQLLDQTRKQYELETTHGNLLDKINSMADELKEMRILVEDKSSKIEKLETQNQQLKTKILSSESANGTSVKKVTTKTLLETKALKKDPSNYALKSSASNFVRNNSLPPSVRSSSKVSRTETKTTPTKAASTLSARTTRQPMSAGSVRWKSSSTTPSATSCLRSSLTSNDPSKAATARGKKNLLLEELKNERNTLLKKGLCRADDPMIKNIEKELKKHGVK